MPSKKRANRVFGSIIKIPRMTSMQAVNFAFEQSTNTKVFEQTFEDLAPLKTFKTLKPLHFRPNVSQTSAVACVGWYQLKCIIWNTDPRNRRNEHSRLG